MPERGRAARRRGAHHRTSEAKKSLPPLVLIVDDDEDQRELMAEFVAREGFRVATASDGEEALESIAQSEPAVVVMDLWMPRLDGWVTTQRLKADARTSAIPVVILSAHALGEHKKRASEAGADAILAKPCPPAVLVARLRELLAGSVAVE
ncbi:MAG TPA: response regulator transcription factor [Labilithrix sp.]|jgi:DNA-binding response OmpR family regulator